MANMIKMMKGNSFNLIKAQKPMKKVLSPSRGFD